MRVIQRRQGDLLALDVLPDVQLGPVADREDAEMLALMQFGIEQVPQLRALRLRLPLAKAVAVAENTFFGAGFLFITSRAANQRVKAEFVNRLQQRDRLVDVAALARMRQPHRAPRHRVFDAAHNQLRTQFRSTKVAEICHFMEVVARVDHQQRVGDFARALGTGCARGIPLVAQKRFFSAFQQHQRVFAARK